MTQVTEKRSPANCCNLWHVQHWTQTIVKTPRIPANTLQLGQGAGRGQAGGRQGAGVSWVLTGRIHCISPEVNPKNPWHTLTLCRVFIWSHGIWVMHMAESWVITLTQWSVVYLLVRCYTLYRTQCPALHALESPTSPASSSAPPKSSVVIFDVSASSSRLLTSDCVHAGASPCFSESLSFLSTDQRTEPIDGARTSNRLIVLKQHRLAVI